MIDINQKNFNDSFSTISSSLNNPFVTKPIQYGDFRSSDSVLNSMLPNIINLGKDNGNANNMKSVFNGNNNLNSGLTSPGFIDNAMKCTGLDFVNTNPDYDKLPFQVCLNKFNTQYKIPEITFNNLMNNLPYTFSALSEEDKKRYLSSLQNFIDKVSIKNGIDSTKDLREINETINREAFIKENFSSKHSDSKHEKDCSSSDLNLSAILSIVLIILIVLVFLLFIANKN